MRLKALVWGTDDPRVRAIWRVLLAGLLFVPLTEVVVRRFVRVWLFRLIGPVGEFSISLSQAVFFAILLVGWARYIDQRPLSDYGLSISRSWALDLLVGSAAVLGGFGVWYGVGSPLGWADVEMAMTAPQGSVVLGLVAGLIAAGLTVWVQQTAFIGVVLKNAAEGLSTRGIASTFAVMGAWLVAVLLFTRFHEPVTPGQVVNLLLVLGLYGLLYVQTGELALPIGVHTGVNYARGGLFIHPWFGSYQPSVFHVTTSLPGSLGHLSGRAIPQLLIAYGLLLGWLKVHRGGVSIETALTHWSER